MLTRCCPSTVCYEDGSLDKNERGNAEVPIIMPVIWNQRWQLDKDLFFSATLCLQGTNNRNKTRQTEERAIVRSDGKPIWVRRTSSLGLTLFPLSFSCWLQQAMTTHSHFLSTVHHFPSSFLYPSFVSFILSIPSFYFVLPYSWDGSY